MHRQAASNTPPATISSIVVPQKPTLAQFEVMFEGTPLILERATDYWESGRVSSVQEIAPQLYHARVAGSDDDYYDVDIRLGKDAHGENTNEANTDDQATTSSNTDHESTTDDNSIRIQSAACTCPYQRTPYCKHIGAVLYELRKQLIGAHGNHHNDDTANAHDGVIALPRTVLDPIQQHLDARAEQGKGHLLFLWSAQLREAAKTFCAQPDEERPLIPLIDAQTMLSDTIRRCHERFIIHISKHSDAYSKSCDYTEFIKTVQAIAGNALQSSDYASACGNLRLCIHEVHALLLSSEDDDGSEPLLTLMDDLAMRVRCYMENVAEFADSPTAGKALNTIAQAANDKDMRQCEPLNSMLLISSALAFAQYDDKRMWAYDVIDNAITRNLEYSFSEESEESDEDEEDEDNEDSSEVDDETDFISDESLHVLQLFTLMSVYDLYALSNDDAGREQLLSEYSESMALTLMNAANMIHEGHLRSAYMLAQGFLLSSRDMEDVDIDARHNGLLPDLLPHGWHTIMECCAEGLNDVGLLANVYRYYILSCNDRSDTHYVSKLRNLLRIYGGLSAEEWHDVADGLARDCARNIIDRIKYQPEMTTKGGTQRHSSWRNPAYEKLIVDERLSGAALIYCVMVDYPPLPLLRTIAIEHPESAKSIILDAMPYGTMGTPVFRFTVERGVDNTLTARRTTYQQIAKQLRRFAAVFGDEETRVLAHEIVGRYPNRTALREELAFAL